MNKKNLFFLFIIFVVFLLSILWLFSGKKKPEEKTQPIIPTPTSVSAPFPRENVPLNITTIPTLPPSKNGGIDRYAPLVKESENQIKKIYPLLPYETTIITSLGKSISITIPAKDLQDNPWSLTVYIFGIDYQTPKESNDYLDMKMSFKEGSKKVLGWIGENGVDINKVFIVWGDKFFIQERSEQWLQED